MKRYLTILCAAFMALVANAQITLTPYVDATVGGLDENNVDLIENKVRTCISSVGMESGYNTRFVLATKINVLGREYTNSAPVQMIQRLSITMAIGDGMTGTCFGSCTFEVKGIGETEEMALLSAVKNMPRSNNQIKQMVAESKQRIIDYYEQNAAAIMAHAQALLTTQAWEEALFELSTIPQECSCYPQAVAMMDRVYTDHINHDARQILNEAQAIWSADPNPGYSAEEAMRILSQINTSAACYPQAQALMKKIEARVKSVTDEDRAYERDMEQRRLKAATTLEKARIKACRDVAVAYAKSRPRVVYHVHSWW